MRGKAWAPGVAVLLAVALAGCTGGEDAGDPDAKRGASDTTTAAAPRPGRFDTLPQPCKAVDRAMLDSLLPGLRALSADEREDGYAGTLAPTFDNERKVGCAWKAESAEADDGAGRTDSLTLDLERVVSYDAAKSDDDRAREMYGKLRTAAHIPDPSPSGSASASAGTSSGSTSPSGTPGGSPSGSPSPSPHTTESPQSGQSASDSPSPATSGDTTPSSSVSPSGDLSGLGDEGFLTDRAGLGSAGGNRTVTVVFRTSNVVVSVVYKQQPEDPLRPADGKEMQDKARKLAGRIAGSFEE
ncbi:hypothetical protein [Streptomyces sp. NPDC047046]|uniref:hypothetical protein n=1 Tax=Streptomyces sp. NPDC047046 TaxID=3155378 RepID=UPI0033E09383